jgi:opacity protein-like surface antigen
MRSRLIPLGILVLILLFPASAFADLTAFLGVNGTPSSRTVRGFSGGLSLVIVGFEFEYANTSEDEEELAPGLKTYMVNGFVQTPFPIAGMQFYGTAGGGVFQESLFGDSETNVGMNVGGGVKVNVVGPLRLRLDYRIFTLRGDDVRHSRPQRFYAGLNLKF